nr:hypothetical protein CFP56_16733 [Quercus suber]
MPTGWRSLYLLGCQHHVQTLLHHSPAIRRATGEARRRGRCRAYREVISKVVPVWRSRQICPSTAKHPRDIYRRSGRERILPSCESRPRTHTICYDADRMERARRESLSKSSLDRGG